MVTKIAKKGSASANLTRGVTHACSRWFGLLEVCLCVLCGLPVQIRKPDASAFLAGGNRDRREIILSGRRVSSRLRLDTARWNS